MLTGSVANIEVRMFRICSTFKNVTFFRDFIKICASIYKSQCRQFDLNSNNDMIKQSIVLKVSLATGWRQLTLFYFFVFNTNELHKLLMEY